MYHVTLEGVERAQSGQLQLGCDILDAVISSDGLTARRGSSRTTLCAHMQKASANRLRATFQRRCRFSTREGSADRQAG